MFKNSFHQYIENSVVYRHLRDYFNNPVKRKQILKGRIYIASLADGDCAGFAFTVIDAKLYLIYSLLLRNLRVVYDDDDISCRIDSIDREFAPMVCAAAPYFGWRL